MATIPTTGSFDAYRQPRRSRRVLYDPPTCSISPQSDVRQRARGRGRLPSVRNSALKMVEDRGGKIVLYVSPPEPWLLVRLRSRPVDPWRGLLFVPES